MGKRKDILSMLVAVIITMCLILAIGTAVPANGEAIKTRVDDGVVSRSDISDLLVELRLITQADVDMSDKISVIDALYVLYRIENLYMYSGRGLGYKDEVDEWHLEQWYENPDFEGLDQLSNWHKSVIYELMLWSVLNYDEVHRIDFEADLTKFDALKYVTRLIGNTYGCVQEKAESEFTREKQTYNIALKKGIIKKDNSFMNGKIISRAEYFELVCNALYAVNKRGGDGGVFEMRYVDELREIEPFSDEEDDRTLTLDAPKNPVRRDDLSVSWTLPKDTSRVVFIEYYVVYDDEEEKLFMTSTFNREYDNTLSGEGVLGILCRNFPRKVAAVKIRLSSITEVSEFMEIDFSDVDVKIEGEPLNLFTLKEDGNYNTTLALGGGDSFIVGECYLVTQYNKHSRNEKYHNIEGMYAFKAGKNSKSYRVDDLFLYIGGGAREFLYLQRVDITGGAGDRLTVVLTPLPDSPFTVVK